MLKLITKLLTTENLNPTRKNFGPTKFPREKVFDPGNTHEKKIGAHEIPTRKNFGPTKYLRDNISDPRNTQEDTMARWHWTHDGTRPTKFSTHVWWVVLLENKLLDMTLLNWSIIVIYFFISSLFYLFIK